MTTYEIRKQREHEDDLKRQAAAWRMVESYRPGLFYVCWTHAMVPVAGLILCALTALVVLGPFVLLAWIAR